MKRISILTVMFFVLVISQGSAWSEDLSANIMRRVNTANDYLDKAETQIRTGSPELAPANLQGATQEYDNIFSYYGGSFDPEHPTLKSLKDRIDKVAGQLAAANEAPSVQAESSPAKAPGQEELSANIRRRIDAADRQLVWVTESAAKGNKDEGSLAMAQREYQNIFDYYQGTFDPDHPDLVALKNRIEAAEQAMNEGFARRVASTPVENNAEMVKDLPEPMGKALADIGSALNILEQRLETAAGSFNPETYLPGVQSDLDQVQNRLASFESTHGGQCPADHPAYLQVKDRTQAGQAAVAKLASQSQAAAGSALAANQAANDAAAQRILGRYQAMEPTSNLHRNNQGRMVWSTKPVEFGEQDRVSPQSSFKLTDPIFSRVYLTNSLGNTPVYSQGGGEPGENRDFGYEYRLFIDGQEKAVKFGVFSSGNLSGEAGEKWTTFQFAPNPVPYDESFSTEAEAWRRATQGLSTGSHAVRFELWGVQGQHRSREPVSVGEFTLEVGQGDRVASGLKFPSDSYRGSDLQKIREAMAQAVVGPVAKSQAEVLKVAVTSDWQEGVYSDTKARYRVISGTLLWHDENNDGTCRFTTYNFISDQAGGGWGPLRFKGFCNGCPEGDTDCP